MTAVSLFEQEKESLRGQLLHATPKEAEEALQPVFARMTEAMAADEKEDAGRQRVRAVMALLLSAPALLSGADARAELVIPDAGKKTGLTPAAGVKYGGFAILAAVAVWLLLGGHMIPALLTVIAALLIFSAKGIGGTETATARGIAAVDADRLLSAASALCRAADICLADLSGLEQERQLRAGLSGDEALLSTLGNLMEAKRAGRPELALESLDEAEQYLRLSGIELEEYDEAHAGDFDVLPTLGESRTIRPAFRKEGRLIRRGLAVVPQRRTLP